MFIINNDRDHSNIYRDIIHVTKIIIIGNNIIIIILIIFVTTTTTFSYFILNISQLL